MPKNRFAEVRYRVLDECLRDKMHRYTLKELAEKCDRAIFQIDEVARNPISLKQIRNDLNHLQSEAGYGAEIESIKLPHAKEHYFRYKDTDFSINKKPLSDDDLQNLKSAVYILQKFGGLHNGEWINEFAARIESLPGKEDFSQQPNEALIVFEHQDLFGGGERIIPLYRAIEKKHSLSISYREFGEEQENLYEVVPYLLKQYNRRWFLLCRSESLGRLTTLPLDRISEIKPGNIPYVPFEGSSPISFFEDIIGVINKEVEPVQKIGLEVHKELLPYVESKLLHESQKKSKPTNDTNWFLVEIEIKTNYEFYSLILSHGPKMRVVYPEAVKIQIKALIGKMANNYK